MTEIQLGETLMGAGDIENGIEHLANAVAVTSHKENLLNVLRTTLPDQIFRMLVEKLPEVSQVI
jgi:import receptor subunit TOM20